MKKYLYSTVVFSAVMVGIVGVGAGCTEGGGGNAQLSPQQQLVQYCQTHLDPMRCYRLNPVPVPGNYPEGYPPGYPTTPPDYSYSSP